MAEMIEGFNGIKLLFVGFRKIGEILSEEKLLQLKLA